MGIDLTEYEDTGDGRLSNNGLLARIEDLENYRAECEGVGAAMHAGWAQELQDLLAFRAEVERLTLGFEDATLVPDGALEHFMRWRAEEAYGIGPGNVGDYVDWTAYARDNRDSEFSRVELAGHVIWVGW